MTAAYTTKNWFENALEKPFLKAELARAEMTKVKPGEESMVPVTLLITYAAGFAAFCGYWVVKLWF